MRNWRSTCGCEQALAGSMAASSLGMPSCNYIISNAGVDGAPTTLVPAAPLIPSIANHSCRSWSPLWVSQQIASEQLGIVSQSIAMASSTVVRQVLMLKFKDSITPEQQATLIDKYVALPNAVPAVKGFEWYDLLFIFLSSILCACSESLDSLVCGDCGGWRSIGNSG